MSGINTNTVKKRIEWVDTAKWMCMMFIMLEHLESGCDELSVLHTTCGVEVFFIAAGYVHRAGQDFRTFLVKKIRCLIVPWLVFSFLDISIAQVFSFGEHGDYLTELLWNLAQIRQHYAQLWFIPALFATFLPFYFFIEWYNRKADKNDHTRPWLFFLLAFALWCVDVAYSHLVDGASLPWGTSNLPWHADYIFIAMFYMTIGYFMRNNFEPVFDRLNTRRNRLILLAVYLCSVYYPYLTDFRMPERLHELFARLINPVMGCTLVCAFSKVIKSSRYIAYVGQNTLLYFAFHGKVLGFAQGMFKRLFSGVYAQILSNKLTSSLFAICLTVIMSFVLIVPCYVVNRWFPFLVGRPMKAKGK